MSEDKDTTFKVGKRNGRLIVLVIDTRKMIKVGILNETNLLAYWILVRKYHLYLINISFPH